MTEVLLAAFAGVLAAMLARSLVRLRILRLSVPNHRGQPVPVVLGLALATATVGAALGILMFFALADRWGPLAGEIAWSALAAVAVAVAGFLDDVRGHGPRGLRGHLGALAAGRGTTGIVKVLVMGVAGVGLGAVTMGDRPILDVVLAGGLAAGAANVWNGLDVAPGRCVKFFLVAAAPILVAGIRSAAWLLLLLATGAAVGVFWFDLRERGMLGDTGSNVLGFLAGAALAPWLTTVGLAIALGVVVALNVLAETVTFSRMIKAVPPLRAFDRLGRMPWGPRFSSN